MLDMIEPTDTILTVIIAGIVFVLMWLLIVLKIGIGPLSMLTSVLSNILERLLNEFNKYIINSINLVVLAAILNCLPALLKIPR